MSNQNTRSILLAAIAVTLWLPFAATAAEVPGIRVSSEPALPIAEHPFELVLDFSGTGDSGWCRWVPDTFSGGPAAEVDDGTMVLWVYRAEPAVPCLDQPPTTVDFPVPPNVATSGWHPVEVRRHSGFLVYDTLARAGVEIQPAAATLSLQRERFLFTVSYVDPRDGRSHVASAVRTSEASGTFWFFDPSNPEVLVKMLDGEGINGYYWLFASSLTTLDFTLTVMDVAGGCLNLPVDPPACPTRSYHHPSGPSRNFEDIESMPAAVAGPEPPLPPVWDHVELRLDPVLPHRGDRVRVLSNFGNDPGWCHVGQGGVSVSESDHTLYLLVRNLVPPILPPPCGDPPPGLQPFAWEIDTAALAPASWLFWNIRVVFDNPPFGNQYVFAETGFELRDGTAPFLAAEKLLLHPEQPLADQFVARVDWSAPAIGASGQAVPTLLSSDSGHFTFFDPSNVEVTLKLLDGRGTNGHWWLFVASQTSLPYTLTVTRGLDCGFDDVPPPHCEVYTFHHPGGTPQNHVDIEAFDGARP